MPYISQGARELMDAGQAPKDAGQLNYVITQLLLDYLGYQGEHYSTYNEIIGVLGCCTQEFYRRMVAPYEDEKIEENGDVY